MKTAESMLSKRPSFEIYRSFIFLLNQSENDIVTIFIVFDFNIRTAFRFTLLVVSMGLTGCDTLKRIPPSQIRGKIRVAWLHQDLTSV